ncbi:MAG: hypothetical protein AAGF84_06440 [Planctomycetota bacterium]
MTESTAAPVWPLLPNEARPSANADVFEADFRVPDFDFFVVLLST